MSLLTNAENILDAEKAGERKARRELVRELRRRLKSALGDRWPVARDEINSAMRATRGR